MDERARASAAGIGRRARREGGPLRARERQRWAPRLRRALLYSIGALYALSIPWYRGDAPARLVFGLPDWVAVALLCYAAAAALNAVAWLLTEIPDAVQDDEARRP